jgi:hypothetical protein
MTQNMCGKTYWSFFIQAKDEWVLSAPLVYEVGKICIANTLGEENMKRRQLASHFFSPSIFILAAARESTWSAWTCA